MTSLVNIHVCCTYKHKYSLLVWLWNKFQGNVDQVNPVCVQTIFGNGKKKERASTFMYVSWTFVVKYANKDDDDDV